MTKQLFLLNTVSAYDAGNIGADAFQQELFPTKEELERKGAEEAKAPSGRGYGNSRIHLLEITLDDNDVVTGLTINRLADTVHSIPSPEYDRLRKWVPDQTWTMPEYAYPLYQEDDEKWIAAVEVGKPITYKKIDD